MKGEEGFGLIEALVGMMIAVTTATVVMSLIMASERSIGRALSAHTAMAQSQDAGTLWAQQAATADYEFVVDGRFPYGEGGCAEWAMQDDKLVYRTWLQGATPGSYVTIVEKGVTEWSMESSGSALTFSLAVKRDTAPTVRTGRNIISTFVPPAVDPEAFPPETPRTDPCE